MSAARGRIGIALVVGVALVAGHASVARGDTPPGLWDSAKRPGARDDYALHVQAQRVLASEGREREVLRKYGQLDHLRALLEDADAEHSPDVRLRFDLGEVYEALELHEAAARVLAPAVAAHEAHPAALSAMSTLSVAYAKLNRRREEHDVYHRYLRHQTDPLERLGALGNLAESDMSLLDLKAAIAGYEEVIARASELATGPGVHQTLALAEWGLAVALDRTGDTRRARAEAKKALALDPEMAILNAPNVFFVPAYERLWYIALGAAAAAAEEESAREALGFLRVAEACFTKYVAAAGTDDPWVGLAKIRLASAEKARAAAEKRVPAAPKRAVPADPDKVFTF